MTAAGEGSEGKRNRENNAFVWCTEESLAGSDADGFEWALPLSGASPEHPSEEVSRTLDPTLVTSRRLPARDDDAVERLAAMKHDPTRGRWRRVESEFVEPPERD